MNRRPELVAAPPQRSPRETEAQSNARAFEAGGRQPALTAMPAMPAPRASLAVPTQGVPLPVPLKREVECWFGEDFSTVRLDAGREAGRAARGFGARAFTLGEQVSFAPGALAPGTAEGRALIAHELTHVLQQRAAGRTEFAFDADPALTRRAEALRVAINTAKDAAERKPLVEQALALADELAAALAAAQAAKPPDESALADLRYAMGGLGKALAQHEGDAAAQLARKTPDVEVQSTVVNALALYADEVGGQQRFYNRIAPLAGETIAPPAKGQTSQQWLKAATPKIGKTLAELDKRGLKGNKRESLALEKSEQLLSNYFIHSEADEKPDPLGDPAGPSLKVDAKTQQIKADCDVYATYGARLLREQGWTTVGYLAIIPNEKKADKPEEDRDAHAVALASRPADAADPKKGTLYVGISNTTIRELGGHGQTLADLAAAQAELTKLAHEVYIRRLRAYAVYWVAAGPDGRYDVRILDPKNAGLAPIEVVP